MSLCVVCDKSPPPCQNKFFAFDVLGDLFLNERKEIIRKRKKNELCSLQMITVKY